MNRDQIKSTAEKSFAAGKAVNSKIKTGLTQASLAASVAGAAVINFVGGVVAGNFVKENAKAPANKPIDWKEVDRAVAVLEAAKARSTVQ